VGDKIRCPPGTVVRSVESAWLRSRTMYVDAPIPWTGPCGQIEDLLRIGNRNERFIHFPEMGEVVTSPYPRCWRRRISPRNETNGCIFDDYSVIFSNVSDLNRDIGGTGACITFAGSRSFAPSWGRRKDSILISMHHLLISSATPLRHRSTSSCRTPLQPSLRSTNISQSS